MDKKTLLTIVLSTIIIVAGFTIQNAINSRSDSQSSASNESAQGAAEEQAPAQQDTGGSSPAPASGLVPLALPAGSPSCTPEFDNGTYRVRFHTPTASIVSLQLLDHESNGRPVEMIFGSAGAPSPFTLIEGDGGAPLEGNYLCKKTSEGIVFEGEFYEQGNESEPFLVRKTYRFNEGEYLFELEVALEHSVNKAVPLGNRNAAYTLYVGPQIGPRFKVLDNRQEYRKYVTLTDRDRENHRLRRNTKTLELDTRADWAAISGKYFSLALLPHSGLKRIYITSRELDDVPVTSEINLVRAPIQASFESDLYRVYFGPKLGSELTKYNTAEDNALGLQELNLQRVIDPRPLIGWLETILRWMLTGLFFLIPNYGVAIILLTIIVKVLLLPLTNKGQRSMERMQALGPQIKELREKHETDRQRLNVEMANLYKKEGVNPAGGCLPLLLQFPFFIAMYGIFYNHFELRNAVFIPGWIDDLSVPESIYNFGDFVLPLLNWNDIRLLPILFVLTSLLSALMNRNPGQTAQQSKMLLLMPAVLFFVLYNLPAGLLVYWIVTNVLTIAQQLLRRQKIAHAT